jgi:hypothetical protein
MFAQKIKIIGLIFIVTAIAGLTALAGPISKAEANTAGGDNFKHYIISTCTPKHISATVYAAGSFNGQVVATRMWAHAPGQAWAPMGGWRYTTVNPIRTFDDGFGSPISSVSPQTLYTQELTTTGGYREIGVEFYWAVNGVWTGYDFFVENTYNQGSPIGFLTTGTCVT